LIALDYKEKYFLRMVKYIFRKKLLLYLIEMKRELIALTIYKGEILHE